MPTKIELRHWHNISWSNYSELHNQYNMVPNGNRYFLMLILYEIYKKVRIHGITLIQHRWKLENIRHQLLWIECSHVRLSFIARFMEPTWGSSGADRTQVGPMLAPWTLLSGFSCCNRVCYYFELPLNSLSIYSVEPFSSKTFILSDS